MKITKKLNKLNMKLPKKIVLVAVSKTKPICDILEAYEAGQRVFGENKIQEMVNKYDDLPKDIKWHMIGHLQRNKVKYIAGFVDLIHGIDSFKTLVEIDKQAKKNKRVINCLLQAKIASEETKFGLSFSEIEEILNSKELQNLENIKIIGLMGMASFTSDKEDITKEFSSLKTFFDKLNQSNSSDKLEVLSMGMSDDYKIALKNGSNMIRVGSTIFGPRDYIA